MIKRKIISLGLVAALTAGIGLASTANSSAEPGGDEDPFVAQSYVDSKINSLTKKIQEYEQKIEALTKSLEAADKKIETQLNTSQTVAEKYSVIEVQSGKSIICGESTELVLRAGKAIAIASEAGGLADLTSDSVGDIKNNANVPTNHLLLIPRDDGRGIKVSSTAWVMIKGKYEIK